MAESVPDFCENDALLCQKLNEFIQDFPGKASPNGELCRYMRGLAKFLQAVACLENRPTLFNYSPFLTPLKRLYLACREFICRGTVEGHAVMTRAGEERDRITSIQTNTFILLLWQVYLLHVYDEEYNQRMNKTPKELFPSLYRHRPIILTFATIPFDRLQQSHMYMLWNTMASEWSSVDLSILELQDYRDTLLACTARSILFPTTVHLPIDSSTIANADVDEDGYTHEHSSSALIMTSTILDMDPRYFLRKVPVAEGDWTTDDQTHKFTPSDEYVAEVSTMYVQTEVALFVWYTHVQRLISQADWFNPGAARDQALLQCPAAGLPQECFPRYLYFRNLFLGRLVERFRITLESSLAHTTGDYSAQDGERVLLTRRRLDILSRVKGDPDNLWARLVKRFERALLDQCIGTTESELRTDFRALYWEHLLPVGLEARYSARNQLITPSSRETLIENVLPSMVSNHLLLYPRECAISEWFDQRNHLPGHVAPRIARYLLLQTTCNKTLNDRDFQWTRNALATERRLADFFLREYTFTTKVPGGKKKKKRKRPRAKTAATKSISLPVLCRALDPVFLQMCARCFVYLPNGGIARAPGELVAVPHVNDGLLFWIMAIVFCSGKADGAVRKPMEWNFTNRANCNMKPFALLLSGYLQNIIDQKDATAAGT